MKINFKSYVQLQNDVAYCVKDILDIFMSNTLGRRRYELKFLNGKTIAQSNCRFMCAKFYSALPLYLKGIKIEHIQIERIQNIDTI